MFLTLKQFFNVFYSQVNVFKHPCRQGLIKTKLLNQFQGSSAAWLVPTGHPVLPVELGTMAKVERGTVARVEPPGNDLVLPGELGSAGVTPSSRNVRRTISGWLLDL